MAGSSMNVDVMVRLKDRLSGPLGRLKKSLSTFTNLVKVGAVAAFAAFTAAMTASIFEAIKFQKLWDEANKTLGMSKHALGLLKDDLDQLAFKIPLARQEFVEMAEQAGNIGIRGRENLIQFIELAAKMGATFDGVDPKQGAKFLGNWRESLGYTHSELQKTVDQINYLGNTTNAGAGPLAKYASDSLAIGDAAGYAREETLALGAAVIAAGKAPEIASTGFRAMNRFLSGGSSALSAPQKSIVKALGLDMDAIQQQMTTDATGAIKAVSAAISQMPVAERSSIVTRLFGDEAARVFGPLLGDIKKLETALGRIDDLRTKSAGSAEAEFLGVSDNVLANWQKLKNVFSAKRDKAGQPYLDPINNALKSTIELLTTLDQRVTVFDRMKNSASGFFKGLGLNSASSSLEGLYKTLTNIKDLIFGTITDDPGEELGKSFNKARMMGEQLKETISGVLSYFADLTQPARDFNSALFGEIANHLTKISGLEMPDLAKLIIDKGAAAGATLLAEGLSAVKTVMDGLKQYADGFTTGFMDNLSDGLAGWEGLGEDIGELGKAFGELYASLKELMTIDDDGMSNIKSFGEILGTLAAGGVGVLGETLKLVVKYITALLTITKELVGFLQGKPIDWDLIAGSGFDVLEQAGDLINSILMPLQKLTGLNLQINWAGLTDGLKSVANEIIDVVNNMIKKLNAVGKWVGLGDMNLIKKFEISEQNPLAANDNAISKATSPKVNVPGQLKTQTSSDNAGVKNPFGSTNTTSTNSQGVQKVEFAPLEHQVTSKVDVGGGVQVSIVGPGRVTGVQSTNQNAPVTANTGRAIGRN